MIWPWRRRRREAELDEEIGSHLAMAARDHESRGASPEEAAYAARREFGNATLVKEITRSVWGSGLLTDVAQDVRLAVRALRRAPGFTLTVVGMLGLGLGAASAMYGILDRLLLRAPAHVWDPGAIFAPYVTHTDSRGAEITRGYLQWREYRLLSEGVEAIGAAAAYAGPDAAEVTVGGAEVEVRSVMTSDGYFDVLGVHPLLGRVYLAGDSAAGAPVAVIGYGFWTRQFGASRDALGATLRLGQVIYTIVGVTPAGFSGAAPDRVDIWVTARFAARAAYGADWQVNSFSWQMIARPRPGRTPEQALSEGLSRLRAAPPDPRFRAGGPYTAVRPGSIVPGRAPATATAGLGLSFVVGAAALLVALIAAANAAGLLLLRALRRRRETAMRLVLGVSRIRLLRGVAVESTVLALISGALACVVAAIGGELLRRLLLRVDWAVPVVDPQVALLTLGVSLVVGFLAGLLPGWLAGRPETVAALKSGVRDGGARRAPARAVLLVVQAGLSLALLSGLALYLRSYARARSFDFGPDVDHVLVAELVEKPWRGAGPVAPAVSRAIRNRVAALPAVAAVAIASATPLHGAAQLLLRAEGVDSVPWSRNPYGGPLGAWVTPSYFAATGLGLVRGRLFLDQGPGGAREAVISEEMARRLWPSSEGLGRCLYVGGEADCTRIVGVVRDVRWDIRQDGRTMSYYIALGQAPSRVGATSLIVRSQTPGRLVSAVRDIVASLAGVRSRDAVRTLRDVVDPQYRRLRQGLTLFGIFAALAVVVAMFGTYSVVAYSVTQREHEFGVRVALGARAGNLARLVIRQALGYVGAGLVLGLAASLLGARYVGPLLYQTSPRDPLALVAAALALVVAAVAASIIPARTAARADPREALAAE